MCRKMTITYICVFSLFLLSSLKMALMDMSHAGCPHNMFLCNATQRCIPRSWLCDQEVDCPDAEDEKNCDNQQHKCSTDEFECPSTQSGVRTEAENPWLSHLTGAGSLFSYTCIPKKWVCDGEADCLGKEDESQCPEVKCGPNHFECKSFDSIATSCIPQEWVCDGQTDCMDMKDEKDCPNNGKEKNKCEPELEFTCSDGQCIYKNWVCDGDHDCADGSDEIHCDHKDTCSNVNRFKCASSNFCIPNTWKCDGEPDCPDHSDETSCNAGIHLAAHGVNCTATEFKCKNNAQCISKFWVCDGDEDCFDGSDERNCSNSKNCNSEEKMCKNGKQCVNAKVWCDRVEDCEDGSDERDCKYQPVPQSCDPVAEYTCPKETPIRCISYERLCDGKSSANDCTKSICNEKIVNCNNTVGANVNSCECRKMGSIGQLCHCAKGYKLETGICTDINECEKPGVCDQICTNQPGTYQCDCYPGYKLTVPGKNMDKAHKCRAIGPDPLLLLANRAAIRQFDIVTNKYHPLINKLESAVALDYWHANNTLVWSDVSKEQIVICKGIVGGNGIGNHTIFESINNVCGEGNPNLTKITQNVSTPDGLAIDWVHGLLFWTDTGTDKISVYDMNTRKRTILISENLDEPRAIAVDPSSGLIFWTDWGMKARIERAGMDGKNRMIIVQGNAVRWPNGLAVDILDKRLYWADAKTKQISSSDYWGHNVRTILHSHQHIRHPFSLAVFEERLYWTDWDQEGVLSVNKFHGGDVKKLMHGVAGPMTVRVYHQQAQPKHENKCLNHGCQHICLPKALYHELSKEQETALVGLPYSCACDMAFYVDMGNSSICIPLNPLDGLSEIAVESYENLKQGNGSRFSAYIIGLMAVFILVGLVFAYQKRRNRNFASLHFDNPIYRRTVEADLEADLENMTDNSLGPIAILPVNSNRDGHFNQNSTPFQDNQSKLVLHVPTHKNEQQTSTPATLVDMSNPHEYGYDQPPPVSRS